MMWPGRRTSAALSAGLGIGLSSAAVAQSSVTLYGIVDNGLTWLSNGGGHAKLFMDSGVMQGNRLGLRGAEDLGGGRRALFNLESGFQLRDGSLGQGGRIFGRVAYVGLALPRWGTATLGRQYDFMYEVLGAYYTPTWSAGGYANNPLDNDRLSGRRVDQAVKVQTPDVAGFKAGLLYGFAIHKDEASGKGRTYSVGGSYSRQAFSAGLAYTDSRGETLDIAPLVGAPAPLRAGGDRMRTWGAGASYALKHVTVYGLYTQARYVGATRASFRNLQTGVSYRATSAQRYGLGYGLTMLDAKRYHQFNLTFDYVLSKRTDLYLQLITMRAGGHGATAAVISMPGASGSNQALLRVGLRHTF